MLETGPARAIKLVSFLGFLRLKMSNCTGLPQPNPKNRRVKVPRGSRWARGLRVNLPWDLGVGSPSLSATRACANSCTDIAKTKAAAQIKNMRGLSNN